MALQGGARDATVVGGYGQIWCCIAQGVRGERGTKRWSVEMA